MGILRLALPDVRSALRPDAAALRARRVFFARELLHARRRHDEFPTARPFRALLLGACIAPELIAFLHRSAAESCGPMELTVVDSDSAALESLERQAASVHAPAMLSLVERDPIDERTAHGGDGETQDRVLIAQAFDRAPRAEAAAVLAGAARCLAAGGYLIAAHLHEDLAGECATKRRDAADLLALADGERADAAVLDRGPNRYLVVRRRLA